MRDGLTWLAALLLMASVGVLVWIGRLSPPRLDAAQTIDERSPAATPAALRPVMDASTPICGFGELMMIAADSDPRHSSAALRRADGTVTTCRAGEKVAGFVVDSIRWDRVSFRRGGERCELLIGDLAPA